jgi:hypothetical protein
VATKSYLAIERASGDRSAEDIDRIKSECQRFGVGLISFGDLAVPDGWSYLVEPNRQEPDPPLLEKFIQDQLPRDHQERIRKWLR